MTCDLKKYICIFFQFIIHLFLGVLAEAHYYGMENAICVLTKMANEKNSPTDGLITLSRKHVVKAIMSTSPTSELRFQGVNFSGADLSKLDLRNINFKVCLLQLK